VNSLLRPGVLAWRSESSKRVVSSEALLWLVRVMETEVLKKNLFSADFCSEKGDDERYRAVIAAFDEAGNVLANHPMKSADPNLWLAGKDAEALKHLVECDYREGTGYHMGQKGLYVADFVLVQGGTVVQEPHRNGSGALALSSKNGTFLERKVGGPGLILYGIKEGKNDRCKFFIAEDNDANKLRKVNVYSGMAIYVPSWVIYAGGNHGGRNASTRLYVQVARQGATPDPSSASFLG
jgi:hypothetical protein